LELFCKATCMSINLEKSSLCMWGVTEQENDYITQLFPYQVIELEHGLKYLGFHLNLNLYKKMRLAMLDF